MDVLDDIAVLGIEVRLVGFKLADDLLLSALDRAAGVHVVLHVVESFIVFVAALEGAQHLSVVDGNAVANCVDFADEDTAVFSSTDQE